MRVIVLNQILIYFSLHVYDIARGKTKKSFNLKSSATCLAVNHCDAYFAAGCTDGSLVLATNASNQVLFCHKCLNPGAFGDHEVEFVISLAILKVAAPMVAPKCAGQKITAVRYSTVIIFFLLYC